MADPDRMRAESEKEKVIEALRVHGEAPSPSSPAGASSRASWIDSRAGSRTGAGTSVHEVVEAIDAMVHLREDKKTLFLVVDEVSQYVHQDANRMLKLQSFVSELGQRLKGRVWLFATGQQKLEDTAETNNLGKLRDRFPTHLRVHLGTTNIRDVVHKRLLKKKPELEDVLRDLFLKHRGDLKLYGYGCEEITQEDFVEVYPMLPGHIDLLMQITSNLRTRSTRVQGDDHAIRGLLQLIGELFREQKLAGGEVGSLVTLDAIFEVQHSALDADVQTTLSRIFNDARVRDDVLAQRAAKAVALLELIQEQTPTVPQLVAQCLYAELGEGNRVPAVTEALEKLRGLSLLSYSEKHGYKIQSSAGQEWQRERDDFGVTQEQISKSTQDALKHLVGSMQERPRWKGRAFPWTLWFSDGRQAHDVKLQDAREDSSIAVDFRFLGRKDDRAAPAWIAKTEQEPLRNRVVWPAGETTAIEDHARQLGKSERMLELNRSRRESLTREKQRLLIEEEARFDELQTRLRRIVAEAFLEGTAFFRGQPLRPRDAGSAFGTALVSLATRVLPDLYPHFSEIAIAPSELGQLLERELPAGPSTKLMDGGLGILSLDAGKFLATCTGVYPTRIAQEIEQNGGLTGQALIATFVGPPYGYAPDLVRACCAGLLRGKKIRIRPEQGDSITSHGDPGVRDLFTRDRDFRRAELFPAMEGEVTARDASPSASSSRRTSRWPTSSPTTSPSPTRRSSSSRPSASASGTWSGASTTSPGGPMSPRAPEARSRSRGLLPLPARAEDRRRGEAQPRRPARRPGAARGHRVLRPIAEAMVDTTAEAVSPTLVEVRDRFASRIHQAEEQANDRLDEELNKETEGPVVPIMKVETHLRGREIQSREQLHALFAELEERM
jgi:hypothetical protein